MESDRKNIIICRIYQILFKYSNADHPLLQQDIVSRLDQEFNIECTRQAVSRNIQNLIDIGIDIKTSKKGSYLSDRPFEDNELMVLIDSILGSRYIKADYTNELINKLIQYGGIGFKNNVKYVYVASSLNKTLNKDVFYNIDIINEAIGSNKKIKFQYKKVTYPNGEKFSWHTASPYQLILHNQQYYLILRDDNRNNIGFYKIDKIYNLKKISADAFPLKDNPEFKNGIDYKKYSTGLPYLFNDEIKTIKFECPIDFYDQLYDWFGDSVIVDLSADKSKLLCQINSSEDAMLYWSLQYCKNVKIIEPQSLKNKVIETLKSTLKLYE